MLKPFNFLPIVFLFVSLFLIACKEYKKNKSHLATSNVSIEKGEEMAKVYCGSCHQFPDPSLLDAKSWSNGVLPAMGERLGISYHGFKQYAIVLNDKSDSKKDPAALPALNLADWQHIVDYYVSTSPDTLPPQRRDRNIITGLPLFKVETPVNLYSNAATCYVKINPGDTANPIIISDEIKKSIYFLNRDLAIVDSVKRIGTVVDINFDTGNLLACDIGLFNPTDEKLGKLESLNKNSGHYQKDSITFLNGLQRPVQLASADFNKDGKTDYLVCEFGYKTGALSWYENTGSGKFNKHIIRGVAGAVKAYVQDYNHDGLPDIWALFAQGEEGVFLFTNKGDSSFEQEEVLRFPPSYGSSYFELADFNKDGYPDILYTCGDNADYSPVLKPYHGVYIFLNDKKNRFKQQYFFPINGCYKAIATDFDNDGDLDIATFLRIISTSPKKVLYT